MFRKIISIFNISIIALLFFAFTGCGKKGPPRYTAEIKIDKNFNTNKTLSKSYSNSKANAIKILGKNRSNSETNTMKTLGKSRSIYISSNLAKGKASVRGIGFELRSNPRRYL